MPLFRRKNSKDAPQVMKDLRARVLKEMTPGELGLVPTSERPRVWAVVMETGFPEAVASLVCVADGSVSMYFSNGGGIIGAGEHEPVRRASMAFLTALEDHVDEFARAIDTPPPAVGRVTFYVRTFGGLRAMEAGENDLGEGRHSLSPMFHAGHAVITQIRLNSPQR